MGKREDILNSALRLFLEKGFSATSIDEITRLAGISKGSFYTYFSSKESLLSEVVRLFLEEVSKQFATILENKKGKPLELLEAFFELNLNLAKEYASNIFTIVREVSFAPIQAREKLTVSFGGLIEERLRDFITTLKGSCDESDIIILLGAVINFWVRFIFNERVPTIQELSRKVWLGLSNGTV
ncbi:MAG: TetR/AcrR family transcriptional regulator [bacterium]|nr:TetR/AcrR family transcriptional regulator [bacterium]